MKRPRTINKPRRIITTVDELPVICDAAEVGLLLRLNPESVNRMARDGTLPAVKLGQTWRFRRDDVMAYLDKLLVWEAKR